MYIYIFRYAYIYIYIYIVTYHYTNADTFCQFHVCFPSGLFIDFLVLLLID